MRIPLSVAILIAVLYPSFTLAAFLPGETLNPPCGPTDPSCVVATTTVISEYQVGTLTATSAATSTIAGSLSVAGVASTTDLVASRSLTIANLSGILRAVAGVVTTTLVNLASDVTGILGITNGGTGANTASGARSNLGAAASGSNSDITSLAGLTTALTTGQGGTGRTNYTQNQILIGGAGNTITQVATSALGLSSSDITEGTNQYFTSTRADTRVAAGIAGTTTTALAEGTNLYFTNSRADTRVAAGIAGTTTTALQEGNNLYFTNERVDDRVSTLLQAGSGISMTYNDASDSLTISSTGGGGGGNDVNWSYYNGSGIRPATTTNQVLIGGIATSSSMKLQVIGGATIDNASTTNFSSSYSSSSAGFFGALNVGGISGILKATGGLVSAAVAGTDYLVSTAGNWAGTLGGFTAPQIIAAGFSTTSATYYLAQNVPASFSTTSADYLATQRNYFSTSSADYWKDFRSFFSTTSADYLLSQRSTTNLPEGANQYFTNARADARINATTTIGTLTAAPNLASIGTLSSLQVSGNATFTKATSTSLYAAAGSFLSAIVDTLTARVATLYTATVGSLTATSTANLYGGTHTRNLTATGTTQLSVTYASTIYASTTYATTSNVTNLAATYSTTSFATSTFLSVSGTTQTSDIITRGPVIDVRYFGAVGNGTVDDTAAIQSAITYAESLSNPTEGPNATVFAPAGYKFRTSSTIKINKPIRLSFQSYIEFTGTASPAILINETNPLSRNTGFDLEFVGIRAVAGNGAIPTSVNTSGSTGIEIRNMQFSRVKVGKIIAFTKYGLFLNSTNNAYANQQIQQNDFQLGEIAYNGVGVYAESISAALGSTQVNQFNIQDAFSNYINLQLGAPGDNNTNNNKVFVNALDIAASNGSNATVYGWYNDLHFAFQEGTTTLAAGSLNNTLHIGNTEATGAKVIDLGTANYVSRLGSAGKIVQSAGFSLTDSGYLGVGTTSPTASLGVSRATAGNAAEYVGGTSPDAFKSGYVQIGGGSLNASGNVILGGSIGIGTTSPGSPFSVQGITNLSTATSTFYGSGGINLAGGCFAIGGTCISGSGGVSLGIANTWTALQTFLGGIVANAATLYAATVGSLTATSTANLYGGTQTSNLTATGTTNLSVTYASQIYASTTYATTTQVANLTATYATTSYLYVSNKVGIGTSTPGRMLSIIGDAQIGSTSFGPGMLFQTSGNYAEISGINHANSSFNPIALTTGATPGLFLTTSSNVGIGTTTPFYKFEVNGDQRVSGNLLIENPTFRETKGNKMKWSVFAASSTYQLLDSSGIALYQSSSSASDVFQNTPLFLMHSNVDQSATAPTLFPNAPGAAIGEDGGTFFRTNAFDIYSTNGLRQIQVFANPTISSGQITAVSVVSSVSTYDFTPQVIAYDYAQGIPGATYGTGATFTANMTGPAGAQSVSSITVNTQGSNYSNTTVIFVQPSKSAPLDVGPQINLTRDVANTQDFSNLGYIMFQGRSSGATAADAVYAAIGGQVVSSSTKSGRVVFATGGPTADNTELFPRAFVGKGVYTLNATYGDAGLDTISTKTFYGADMQLATSTDGAVGVNVYTSGTGSNAIQGRVYGGLGSGAIVGASEHVDSYPGYFANTALGTSCVIGNNAGGPTCSSDEQLKENISTITNPLEKLQAIRGVTFDWKSARDKKQFIGVIAQDVQHVFPQSVSSSTRMVGSTTESYFSVDYASLVAPIIQGVNEISRITGYFKQQLIAWLGATDNGLEKICLKKSDGSSVCTNGDQLAALLSSQPPPPTPITPQTLPPASLTLLGNDPVEWQLNTPWNDGNGALFTHTQGSETIYSTSTIDTAIPGTTTIEYWAFDPAQSAWHTKTRAVVIPSPPITE